MSTIPHHLPIDHASHDHIAFWLHRLSAAVLNKFEKELVQRNVTYAQWQIMITIYRQKGSTPKEIAAYLAVDAAAISRGAQRLLDKSFLKKVVDNEDRRSVRLMLTQTGEQVMHDTLAICELQEELWLSQLTPEKKQMFIQILYELLCTQDIEPTGAVWVNVKRK